MSGPRRLLLLSNSTLHGSGYLDHAARQLRAFLAGCRRVAFVPYAMADLAAYTARARERFAALGFDLVSTSDSATAVEQADAVFVGGGNTFRLLDALYRHRLIEAVRSRVASGIPYVGSSAGSIVACPTLKTTKDMPVVEPPSFDALGLVRFQISPHYLDPDPAATHMGETQEQRIGHYHEMNDLPVVGLREGSMLRVEGPTVKLEGIAAARLFFKGRTPEEHGPGARLDHLLR